MSLLTLISTGSQKGNCYKYNSLLLDLGCSYSKVKPYLDEIEFIFISHKHGDHANLSTMQKVKDNYPNIVFLGSPHVEYIFVELGLKYFILDKPYELREYIFKPYKLYHDMDAPNTALYVEHNDLKGMYISDTAHVQGLPEPKLDWLCIEYNHDLITHTSLANGVNGTRFSNAMNSHLNFTQSDEYVLKTLKIGGELLRNHLSTSYDPFDYDLHFKYEKGDLQNDN